jgi:hypothetical protein
LTLATLHTNKNKTEIHMDFKRKLLIAALPLAFCLSSTAYAEMTLKIAEIHPCISTTTLCWGDSSRLIIGGRSESRIHP